MYTNCTAVNIQAHKTFMKYGYNLAWWHDSVSTTSQHNYKLIYELQA
jgi:hypothetical protein